MTACPGDCPDAQYWQHEAWEARGAMDALAVRADLPADERRAVVEGLSAPALSAPVLADPEPLAYEDGPASMTTAERALAALLVGPWVGCTASWAYLTGMHELWRWLRR